MVRLSLGVVFGVSLTKKTWKEFKTIIKCNLLLISGIQMIDALINAKMQKTCSLYVQSYVVL